MKIIKSFRIRAKVKPRPKTRYPRSHKGRKPFPYPTAHLFKQDIADGISLGIKESNNTSFPIKGDVSLLVEVSSSRQINIAGVLKNVLDACVPRLIPDDQYVGSTIIRKVPSIGNESVHLYVTSGRKIYSINSTLNEMKALALMNVTVQTDLEDNYQVIPRKVGDYSINESVEDDWDLMNAIQGAYDGELLRGPFGLALTVYAHKVNGDIDNMVMSFIKCSTGIIYEDPSYIETLYINRVIDTSNAEGYEVSLYY